MNVKANESDTQGIDYDIRDRKLTTATSQSGVNTSDVVLLKDTSGNYHEITKDSFMGAVRSALGSLIKNYDKGTNVNGIAVTGSTGTVNDLGFSSPSDLAAVLGGTLKTGYTSDLNNTFTPGVYEFEHTDPNKPINYGACLVFRKSNTRIYQLAYGYDNLTTCHTYFRMYADSWTAWQEVTTEMPTFYKNFATLSGLVTGINDINITYNSGITDLNDVSNKYLWTRFTSKPTNAPSGLSTEGGFLLHAAINPSTNKVQFMFDYDGAHGFFRTYWGTSWRAWVAMF